MENQKVTCKNCKHYSKSMTDEPCFSCVAEPNPHAKYEPCFSCVAEPNPHAKYEPKTAKKVRTDITDLSKMTITLTEIEDPVKGRGCKVEVNGETSVRSMAKMLHTLFCVLAKKESDAFFAALGAFIENETED